MEGRRREERQGRGPGARAGVPGSSRRGSCGLSHTRPAWLRSFPNLRQGLRRLTPVGTFLVSPACRPAPVLASSAGHLNHSRLVGRAASARSELPGASEEGLGKRSRRGRGTLLVRKGPGGGSGAPLFPSHPLAPISPHRRRPRQLFNHYPTDFLAGGPPSPPPLLRVLRRDPEAQRGGLHGRYRWPRGWGGPPPSPRSQWRAAASRHLWRRGRPAPPLAPSTSLRSNSLP